MNTIYLQNAILLSKRLNFSRTAEEINIVQPALSRQIQQLEEELGISLFKRSKRVVELTEAGKYYLEEMEEVLDHLKQLQKKAKMIESQGEGELRVGFTYSALQSVVPQAIEEIKKLKPGIQVVLIEMNNREQFKALRNKKVDFCFATNPIVPGDLEGKKLREGHFAVLLPKNHPVDQSNYSNFSVFSEDSFIFPTTDYELNYPNVLKGICMEAGFNPKITHITGSANTSFKLVEEGMGICIEPLSSIANQNLPIKHIVLTEIDKKAELVMIWNRGFSTNFSDILEHLLETLKVT
nr:LysR family transcriptional regulator [Allomuricauda sp.]